MITLHTFASGSEGNCLLLDTGRTRLLLDAGISTRRICTALTQLGLSLAQLDGILLTHSHTDHVSGLQTMVRKCSVPLYASDATARQLCYRMAGAEPMLRTVSAGETFMLGDAAVSVFATSHDAPGSVDYRIDCGESAVGVLTDTGFVTDEAAAALRGVGLLVLESNHDVEYLRSGPYPAYLKARILGQQGHLSNETAAAFAREMAGCGTRQIVLAHLSRENNTPQRALCVMDAALRDCACQVTVAPRGELSPAYII